MTTSAQQIPNAFDGLSPVEQQQVAAEILRRTLGIDELPQEALEKLAADLFRSYDAEEATGPES